MHRKYMILLHKSLRFEKGLLSYLLSIPYRFCDICAKISAGERLVYLL